jgi:hypothetical protein
MEPILIQGPNTHTHTPRISVRGGFLDTIGQNPSVSECNRLRVVIFRFFLYQFEVYSIDASKTINNFS